MEVGRSSIVSNYQESFRRLVPPIEIRFGAIRTRVRLGAKDLLLKMSSGIVPKQAWCTRASVGVDPWIQTPVIERCGLRSDSSAFRAVPRFREQQAPAWPGCWAPRPTRRIQIGRCITKQEFVPEAHPAGMSILPLLVDDGGSKMFSINGSAVLSCYCDRVWLDHFLRVERE